MPKKRPPEPPKIDWAEYVESIRMNELARRHNRPSDMLRRHSRTWREPYRPNTPKWLGGPWLTAQERAEGDLARTGLLERMNSLFR